MCTQYTSFHNEIPAVPGRGLIVCSDKSSLEPCCTGYFCSRGGSGSYALTSSLATDAIWSTLSNAVMATSDEHPRIKTPFASYLVKLSCSFRTCIDVGWLVLSLERLWVQLEPAISGFGSWLTKTLLAWLQLFRLNVQYSYKHFTWLEKISYHGHKIPSSSTIDTWLLKPRRMEIDCIIETFVTLPLWICIHWHISFWFLAKLRIESTRCFMGACCTEVKCKFSCKVTDN